MNDLNDLNDFREKIDETDENIVKLLVERFNTAKDIAEYKKKNGLEIFQKSREAEVLKNIGDRVENPQYKKYILEIYETILKTSKSSQQDRIR